MAYISRAPKGLPLKLKDDVNSGIYLDTTTITVKDLGSSELKSPKAPVSVKSDSLKEKNIHQQ